MKRNPHDPEGEYQRERYPLNTPVDDVFCAEECPPMPCTTFTITDRVVQVIRQRERKGQETYGQPLLAGDGRDTLQDAIEEAADLLQYLVKLKVERGG